jgi:zinc transporter
MAHPAAENRGVICAFQLSPFGARAEDALDLPRPELPSAAADQKSDPDQTPEGGTPPVWLHLNLTDARARLWLGKSAALPAEARALLLSSDPRTFVEVIDDGVVAVLGDLDHDFHQGHEGFGALRVYLDGTRIITGRRHPLKAVDLLRRKVQAQAPGIESPIALFELFIECLASSFETVVSTLASEVDDAEELVLAGQFRDQGKALGRMRRSLARLRRLISADRAALAPLPRRLPGSYSAAQREGLRQAVERLEAVGQDLELVQERARLLQEEIDGRLTEATNRNLFLLSVVTTTLLPITLITGVFGMNVGGLPWVRSSSGFWWVLFLMLIAVVVTLAFLRRRRVL